MQQARLLWLYEKEHRDGANRILTGAEKGQQETGKIKQLPIGPVCQ
jgi:hypothetical protein